jgi:hypothetical protein
MEAGWEIHRVVEETLLCHSAADPLERRRLLLADMAIHLLQTAIKPGDIELDKLKNNLHAILTISDQFLPHADLKNATKKIYMDVSEAGLQASAADCKPGPSRLPTRSGRSSNPVTGFATVQIYSR